MNFHPLKGGLHVFHPSTNWSQDFSTIDKNVTTSLSNLYTIGDV
jgi:hypothetical protein